MTLGLYCAIVMVFVLLYGIGIAMHKEVAEVFGDIKGEMTRIETSPSISKSSLLSYPFFLAHKRAQCVHWVVDGLFSFVALISLLLWFALSIVLAIDKGINFSDTIDVVDVLGVFGIVQPAILFLAIVLLTMYGLEAREFNRWRRLYAVSSGS